MERILPAFGLKNVIRLCAFMLTLGFMFGTKSAMAQSAPTFSYAGAERPSGGDTIFLNVCAGVSTVTFDSYLITNEPDLGETLSYNLLSISSGSMSGLPDILSPTTAAGTYTPSSIIFTVPSAGGTATVRIRVNDGTADGGIVRADTIVIRVRVVATPTVGGLRSQFDAVRVGDSLDINTSTFSGGAETWSSSSPSIFSISNTGMVYALGTGGLSSVPVTATVTATPEAGCPTVSASFNFRVNTATAPFSATSGASSLSIAKPGQTITVTGSGFNSTPTNNIVLFGAVRGRVTGGSGTTSLNVVVPVGATYSRIVVIDSLSKLAGTVTNTFLPYYDTVATIPNTLGNYEAPVRIPLRGGIKTTFGSGVGGSVTGVRPYSVEYGDLDGDGLSDIVVAGTDVSAAGIAKIWIYRNTTTNSGVVNGSTYAAPVSVEAGGNIVNIKIADVDNDGKPEIISACSGAALVGINKNNSTPGTINMENDAWRIPTRGTPTELTIGDFNKDGRNDIAVLCAGYWEPSITSLTIPGSVMMITNNYDRSVDSIGNIAIAAYAVTAFDTSIIFAYNDSGKDQPISITSGDFNGDGYLDLAVSEHARRNIAVFRSLVTTPGAAITFASKQNFSVAAGAHGYPNQIRNADFDGDVKADIAVAVSDSDLLVSNVYNGIAILKNISSGGVISFATPDTVMTGVAPVGLAVGDIDGDSRPDIVNSNSGDATVSIIRNTSSGSGGAITWGAVRSITISGWKEAAPVGVAIGDIDGNTVPDIAIVSREENVLTLLRGNPLPDTSAIKGRDTICIANNDTLTSFHRIGSVGTWSVSNTAIATVFPVVGLGDTATIIRGISAGTVRVTYTVVVLSDTNRVVRTFFVTPDGTILPNISGATTVCNGSTTTLTATPALGVWSSSDTSIATISTTGVVTGVAVGSVNITYTTGSALCGYNTDVQTINVTPSPNPGTIIGSHRLCTSSSATYTNTTSTGTFTWVSSNPSVASITSGGVLTSGTATGTTTIIYSVTAVGCGSATDTQRVNVSGSIPARPTINAIARAINVGASVVLSGTPSGGAWSTFTGGTIASISTGGRISGIAEGVDSVTYTITAGCGSNDTTIAFAVVSGNPPVILNVTPIRVNPRATTVTITGNGFNPSPTGNIVFFGTTIGRVLSGTGTSSLSVEVPLGTLHSMVMVMDSASKLYATYTQVPVVPYYDSSAMIPSTLDSFMAPVNIALPGGRSAGAAGLVPYSVEIADIDQDGRQDIVVSGTGRDSVYVYKNIQPQSGTLYTSSFAAPLAFGVPALPSNIKVADLDGDTKPEIVVNCAGAALVAVLRNNSIPGTIAFGAHVRISNVAPSPTELAVADFDRDGRIDIALTASGDYYLASSSVLPGRLLVLKNNFNPYTLPAITAGSFNIDTIYTYRAGDTNVVVSLAAADFDGDGFIDLATTERKGRTVDIFQNTSTSGTISFASAPVQISTAVPGAGVLGVPLQVRTGDFDNDGHIDLAVAAIDSDLVSTTHAYNSVQVYRNTMTTSGTITSGSFGSRIEVTTGQGTTGLAVGDFNGDRLPDVVASNASAGSVSLVPNNSATAGTISFGTSSEMVVDTSAGAIPLSFYTTIAVAMGDLDSNTVMDLAVVSRNENILTLFRGFPVPDTSRIVGLDTICAADSTILTSSHRAGSRGYWSSRNGNAIVTPVSGSDLSAVMYGANPGADTITYTVVALYDTNRVHFIVNIRPRPDSGSITGTRIICANDSITLSNAVTGGVWSSSDASIATVTATGVVKQSGTASGTAVISYTTSNGYCTATDTFAVRINPLPNAGAIVGDNVICISFPVSLSNTSATGGVGSWNILRSRATLSAATATSVTVTGVTTGVDSVYYVSTSSVGCGADTTWFGISVLTTGTGITISDTTRRVCVGNSYTYTSSFAGGAWFSRNTAVATIDSNTGRITGVGVGSVVVVYRIISPSCGIFADSVTVFVDTLNPGVITGASRVCIGGVTTLSNTVTTGTWVSRNPSLFTVSSTGVVTGVAPGTDSVMYVISGACGFDTAFHSMTVDTAVTHGPVTFARSPICAGDTTLAATIGTGGIWSSLNTSIAAVGATTGVVTGARRGTVGIVYTITTACGDLADTAFITVDSTPIAGSIIGDTVCSGGTLALRDTLGSGGGVYTSLDPTIATVTSSGVLTGVRSGTVTIKYVVRNLCGADSVTKNIVVDTIPSAGVITGDDSICSGATTLLTSSAGGGTWTTSDASVVSVDGATGDITGVGTSAAFRFATITYTVTSSFGCGSGVSTYRVNVYPTATPAVVTGTTSICDTAFTTLAASVTGGYWTTSNAAIATVDSVTGVVTGVSGILTGAAVTINYVLPSIYGCGDVVTSTAFTVYSKPNVPVVTPTTATLCLGVTVVYTGTVPAGGAATGSWITAASPFITQSVSGLSNSVRGDSTGTDSVTFRLTSTFGCGSRDRRIVVTVDSTPNAGVITVLTDSFCIDADGITPAIIYSVDSASGYVSSSWSSVSSDLTVTSSAGTSATAVASGSGTQTILFVVNSRACGSDTSRLSVVTNFYPDAGRDSVFAAFCPGDTLRVTTDTRRGTSLATTWYSDDTTVVTVTTGSITALVTAVTSGSPIARTANVFVVDSGACGLDTAVFTFTVNPAIPNPGIITGSPFACIGDITTLSDTVSGGVWSSSNNAIATINSSGVVTAVSPGTVTIIYKVTSICGSDSTTFALRVSNAPRLVRPTIAPICDSTLLTVNPVADSAGATFTWSRPAVFGIANPSDTGSGSVNEYLDDTTGSSIIVKYIYTSSIGGCSSVDSFNVTVKPTPYLASSAFDTVCSGSPFFYAFAASTGAGTIGAWSRANIVNITPAGPVTGTGNISELLTNSTIAPINVPYVYNITSNGCSSNATVLLTVNPTPGSPKITTRSAPNLCLQTNFMNFGAETLPPPSVTYYWTADFAQVWATGRSKQYSLVTFGQTALSVVYLNAIYPGYQCPAKDSYVVNVSAVLADSPKVIYWNGDFICLSNDQDTYQWGYDDVVDLDSTMFVGQTNQNYTDLNPDFTGKYYWCITTKDGCMQKSYFRIPTSVSTVSNMIGDMRLYPNPAEQYVNIEINNAASGKFDVEVVDMLGRKLATQAVRDHKATININDFASGVYFVECYHNGVKFATAKFVKN